MMNFKKKSLSEKGFTLSEIIVVIVLLPLVTGAVYSFFSIGVRTHQRTHQLSMFNASIRMTQKLISEKLETRSDKNFSTFMKQEGFSNISPFIADIMKQPLSGINNKLYQALGFSNFAYHSLSEIENCTSETLVKKLAETGFVYKDELAGPYIYEFFRKEEIVQNKLYNLGFDIKPSGFLGGSFLDVTDSVLLAMSSSLKTMEINFPAHVLKDMSSLLTAEASSDAKPFFTLTVSKGGMASRNVFNLFFSFDSKLPPTASISGGFSGKDIKKYFVVSANVFCDDGMLFYEEGGTDEVTNHAIYITEGPPEEAEYDDYGKRLKQLRYASGKKISGSWVTLDDILIDGISSAIFSYYDASGNNVKCDAKQWKWHKSNEISKVVLEVLIDNSGSYVPTRLVFDL